MQYGRIPLNPKLFYYSILQPTAWLSNHGLYEDKEAQERLMQSLYGAYVRSYREFAGSCLDDVRLYKDSRVVY